MKRRSRFSHDNDSVRYCETEEANRLNCWSPSTSVKVDLRAAEQVAAARHAERHRRPALEEHLLEAALLLGVVLHQRVGERRLEVDDRPGRAEVVGRHRGDLVLAIEDVETVVALQIGDKRQPHAAAVAQHHRRQVAGQRIRVLLQLVGLEVQRPQVVDLPVARDVRIDRFGRVHRRRREHQRVGVPELRAALVVGAERDLLLVAAVARSCGTASRCRSRA